MHRVEQIARALAVDRRHRKHFFDAERVELVEVRRARIVDLVGDEHPRLAANCAAVRRRGSRSDAGRPCASTTNSSRSASPIASSTCRRISTSIGMRGSSAMPPVSTSQNARPAQSVSREMPVARRARFFGDDRAVVADDAVEQRGLSDVRPADQCDDGNAHAAASATRGSPSCDEHVDEVVGRIHRHAASASRSVMNGSSSRNTPLSLMHSAGISARSRSWRSASARRMSAPTSRPAVVVVGPNSEFSVDDELERAPVASRELLEQLGHQRAPSTRRSRRRCAVLRGAAATSRPSCTRERSDATAPTPFSICGKSP